MNNYFEIRGSLCVELALISVVATQGADRNQKM
jgi:hypothetical protein